MSEMERGKGGKVNLGLKKEQGSQEFNQNVSCTTCFRRLERKDPCFEHEQLRRGISVNGSRFIMKRYSES